MELLYQFTLQSKKKLKTYQNTKQQQQKTKQTKTKKKSTLYKVSELGKEVNEKFILSEYKEYRKKDQI